MKFGRFFVALLFPLLARAQGGLVGAAIAGSFVGGAFPPPEKPVVPALLYALPDGERMTVFQALPGGGLRVASRTDAGSAVERVVMPDAAMVLTLAAECAPLYARAGEGVLIRCGETAYFRHAATGRIYSFALAGDAARVWQFEASVYIARPAGGSWQIELDGTAWRTDMAAPEPRAATREGLRLDERGLHIDRHDGEGFKPLVDARKTKSLSNYGWVGQKWVWVQQPGGLIFYDAKKGERIQKLPGKFKESDQAALVSLDLASGDRGLAYPKGSDRVMWLTEHGGEPSGYSRVEFSPAPGVVLDAPPAPAGAAPN